MAHFSELPDHMYTCTDLAKTQISLQIHAVLKWSVFAACMEKRRFLGYVPTESQLPSQGTCRFVNFVVFWLNQYIFFFFWSGLMFFEWFKWHFHGSNPASDINDWWIKVIGLYACSRKPSLSEETDAGLIRMFDSIKLYKFSTGNQLSMHLHCKPQKQFCSSWLIDWFIALQHLI